MHLAEGTVRRYLDEPAAVSDPDRDHLAGCERCQSELARARDDRDTVARALDAATATGPAATGPAVTATHPAVTGPAVTATHPAVTGPDAVDRPAVTGPDAVDRPAVDRPAVDRPAVDRAWAALNRRLDEAPGPAPDRAVSVQTAVGSGGQRRRPRLVAAVVRRPLAAVVVAGVVVLGGGAAAAAADWLPVFQAKKVTPVQVSSQDLAGVQQLAGQLNTLTELSAFGDVVAPPDLQPSTVPDAATAAARTGLTVPRVAKLPTGVEGTPTYQVVGKQTLEFTFSAAKAAQAVKARGASLPPMPGGLDGTRLRIEGGPGVAEVWGQRSGVPTLVVVRAKAPTVATHGVSLEVVRDYLLSMPGISPQLAAQLRNVTGDGTTLPIPVPSEVATSSQAEVGGVQATVIETRNTFGVAVVWVDGGELNFVLGPLSKSEVLAVARGLR
jgi:hypothetical protein